MKYLVTQQFHCKGTTTVTYSIDADSEEEAKERVNLGEGVFYDEVPDIQIYGNPLDTIVEKDIQLNFGFETLDYKIINKKINLEDIKIIQILDLKELY